MKQPNFRLQDFDFYLPKNLIAQTPVKSGRDRSRLMVLNRQTQTISYHYFFELPLFLRAGDLLVMNNSKVFPGRLEGKKETGGKVEILLLRQLDDGPLWEALGKSSQFKTGAEFVIKPNLFGVVLGRLTDMTWQIKFNASKQEIKKIIYKYGRTPLPPYIKHTRLKEKELRQKYQTIYAKYEGSAAAPTAGFHFTKKLFKALKVRGVGMTEITLHVGLGTFAPVRTQDISQHQMHKEFAEVSSVSVKKINQARKRGGRIIAVGTTVVRTLEAFWQDWELRPGKKFVDKFITPGYGFQGVDALITNFHLPCSTLLMLVCAFGGYDFVRWAYKEAVRKKYRFYSFGDAMLIL